MLISASITNRQCTLTIGGNMNFQAGGPVRVSVNQYSYSIPKRGAGCLRLVEVRRDV